MKDANRRPDTNTWRFWTLVAVGLLSLSTLVLGLGVPTSVFQEAPSPSPNPLFEQGLRADSALLIASSDTFRVPVAASREERVQGLQGRQSLEANEGLLFVSPEIEPMQFWMKNTPLPLSVAWMNTQGRVLEIQDMKPNRTTIHQPDQPAALGLEMSAGWFQQHQIDVGDVIHIQFLP